MDKVIKLVKTYRLTPALDQKLRLADEIFASVEPDIRLFVFSAFSSPAAEDVLQESLRAIATAMGQFDGDTTEQFYGWCYRIARNKLADHFRSGSRERVQPVDSDELWELIDASEAHSPLSPQDRIDLDYAMQLLTRSKPECFDYLWQHFVFGLSHIELAEQESIAPDTARMRVNRCLEQARSLVA